MKRATFAFVTGLGGKRTLLVTRFAREASRPSTGLAPLVLRNRFSSKMLFSKSTRTGRLSIDRKGRLDKGHDGLVQENKPSD